WLGGGALVLGAGAFVAPGEKDEGLGIAAVVAARRDDECVQVQSIAAARGAESLVPGDAGGVHLGGALEHHRAAAGAHPYHAWRGRSGAGEAQGLGGLAVGTVKDAPVAEARAPGRAHLLGAVGEGGAPDRTAARKPLVERDDARDQRGRRQVVLEAAGDLHLLGPLATAAADVAAVDHLAARLRALRRRMHQQVGLVALGSLAGADAIALPAAGPRRLGAAAVLVRWRRGGRRTAIRGRLGR